MPDNIAVWSADYTIVTGQALVTRRVVENVLAGSSWRGHFYGGNGLARLARWLRGTLGLWRDAALGRVSEIYLVCSRSNGGFLRDVPALILACIGFRVVVHAHGSDIVDLLNHRWLSPLARTLYSACEIVTPSRHLLAPLRASRTKGVHLCENFFAEGRNANTIQRSDQNSLLALWNSNVMASKGFFDLAEAVKGARAKGHEVQMISLGRPLADEEMSEPRAHQGLSELQTCEWFEYVGPVDEKTAIAYAHSADVVCLPSRYSSECQPLALIEAMCAGVEVIAADTPALRATVANYPASFVSAKSVAEIESVLVRLAIAKASGIKHDLTEARNLARRRFSPSRFDREMLQILSGASPSEILG